MASIRQRNDPVRILWRRLSMLILTILMLFGIWAVVGVYLKERESSNLRVQAEIQRKDLEKRQVALKERIATLETERGQEAALRDQYQVGKVGEGMITIVDKPATSSTRYSEEKVGWWKKVFWWW